MGLNMSGLYDMSDICPKCGTAHIVTPYRPGSRCRKCNAIMPPPNDEKALVEQLRPDQPREETKDG